MPETRYVRRFDIEGNELEPEPYEVSDEQLADEQEQALMEKAEEIIDGISNLDDAKVFLKKLCKRLFKNDALP